MNHPKNEYQQIYDMPTLSLTIKFEIARWIRQSIMVSIIDDRQVQGPETDEQQVEFSAGDPGIVVSLDQFTNIRRIMVALEDYHAFADVLELISKRASGAVLTAVADTINFYFDTFHAIGAASGVFGTIYKRINQSEEAEGQLLESLIDLGCRLPNAEQAVHKLRKEMAFRAFKNPAAASSPISDTMIEAVQDPRSTFADEIDQMLTSGTSMDKRTVMRIFDWLVVHLENSLHESNHLLLRYSQLLATLRKFDSEAFDVLFNKWLHLWLQSSIVNEPFNLLLPLICLEILSLKDLFRAIIEATDYQSNQNCNAGLALAALDFVVETLFSQNMTTADVRVYRAFDQLQSIMRTTPIVVINIILRVVGMCQAREQSIRLKAGNQIRSEKVLSLVQSFLLWQSERDLRCNHCMDTHDVEADSQRSVDDILRVLHSGDALQSGLNEYITGILEKVNEFNVLMSGSKVRAALASVTVPPPDATVSLTNFVIEQIATSSGNSAQLWACLASQLPAKQASLIREHAEDKVLAWAIEDAESTLIYQTKQVNGLMCIIKAFASHAPTADIFPFVERIAAALGEIIVGVHSSIAQHRPNKISETFYERVDTLLRLLIIHHKVLQQDKKPQIHLSLITALSLLLFKPLIAAHTKISHRIFDTLLFLSDSLSNESRYRCIQMLRDDHHIWDPRLRFVFGDSDPTADEWSQLSTKHCFTLIPKLGAPASVSKPFSLRNWEMMQDATPVAMENDTSLSLTLFGSRKSVL